MGILSGFLAIVAIDRHQWNTAFLWLLVCQFIDGADGTLARKFEVDKYLPSIRGKQIDFVVDFTCYAVIPSFFFYKVGMVQGPFLWVCIGLILLSSTLYYGKTQMTSEDQMFVGFPVLWNLAIFYLYFVFGNISQINCVAVFILAILHFVPLKYPYPSQSKNHYMGHLAVSFVGFLAAASLLLSRYVVLSKWLLTGSLLYFSLYCLYYSFNEKEKTSGSP